MTPEDIAATAVNTARLRPRAVAVLVALRCGGRPAASLCHALADPTLAHTLSLLEDMKVMNLVVHEREISRGDVTKDRWRLSASGLRWLQDQGMDASDGAKAAIFV